jgi:hypothetical protein
MKVESTWTVYRTRFVVRARQLTEPLVFTDALGREHSGHPGDYVVESSEGFRCIRPRALFENIYVPLQASPAAHRTLGASRKPGRRAYSLRKPLPNASQLPLGAARSWLFWQATGASSRIFPNRVRMALSSHNM